MNLGFVLEQSTPMGGVPPRFPALVDWVNTGGCPEALAEASRWLTELARRYPDDLADLLMPLTKEGAGTSSPSGFAEVTGLAEDGVMLVGMGPQPTGNASTSQVSITALAELWLKLPRETRPGFPLRPLVESWASGASLPVSSRSLISPAIMPGASGQAGLPLTRAPALLSAASVPLKRLDAPVSVVMVDGEPVGSPSVAPRVFYRPFGIPRQGELWPAPRTIEKADALCPILSALAAHPLDSDERCPLRSYVYRIVLLGHALSGRAFIPEQIGVKWLTGGPVTHANRRRFWDAMAVADSIVITIDPVTHEWRKLVVADPGDGGVHLSPPAWRIAQGERTGGFRLTGALWRPAVLAPRNGGRGSAGVGVWGGLHRTLAGLESALSYGPTGGRGSGARIPHFLRPERPGGPGPPVFVPWDRLLTLAGECVPYGGEGRNTASRRYRRRVEALAGLGYITTGAEAPAADTIEIVERKLGRRNGADAGIIVRATSKFVEAHSRAQSRSNWSMLPASALLERSRI